MEKSKKVQVTLAPAIAEKMLILQQKKGLRPGAIIAIAIENLFKQEVKEGE